MKALRNIAKWVFPELPNRTFVSLEDYEWLDDYCNRLVELGKLPCPPKDLENLRNANGKFAQENFELKKELDFYYKIMERHSNAASIFQPDGKYHKEANLELGSDCITEGIKWLDATLDEYKEKLTIALAENHALTQQIKEKKQNANEEYIRLVENKLEHIEKELNKLINDKECLQRDYEISESQVRFLQDRINHLKETYKKELDNLQATHTRNNAYWKNKCESAEKKLDEIRKTL
jgi:chromosome segregation ATPase